MQHRRAALPRSTATSGERDALRYWGIDISTVLVILIFTMTPTATVPTWSVFERHAKIFQALSDARRLRIIDLLRGGERCVCDLQADLECAQSLLSFHLKTLRDASLVTVRRDGRWAYYALATEGLGHAEQAIKALARSRSVQRWLPVSCCG